MAAPTDRWSGQEHCAFCLQRYAESLEVYCVHCDRPVCPLCVVRHRVQTALVCPECTAEDAGARGEDA